MDEALVTCRLLHFASVMVLFGGGAFRLYTAGAGDAAIPALFDARHRHLLLVSSIAALLSALMFVPVVGSAMVGSASAALDRQTISPVMFDTSFDRVWRWHLLIAALLVVACAIRQVRTGYSVALSAVLSASLGWVGHAAGQGQIALCHEINHSVYLLAGGIWLGGLVPLRWSVAWARRSEGAAWLAFLRDALPQFSRMGYAASFLALTGLINTILLVGGIDGLIGTAYGRVLLLKILLSAALVAVAVINRLTLVPWIHRETTPSTGTAALLWTVGIEQVLGLVILAVTSVLGTLPPAIDVGAHLRGHDH
jgi:putative copper resistance protein D